MKEARKPQLDLRTTCAVGGSPDALAVSPDGSELFVFDREQAAISVIGVAKWQLLGKVGLADRSASSPFFLAGFEDSIFLGGLPGKVGVFSAASRRHGGSIPCDGDACDLATLPEARQAVLAGVAGNAGFIELMGLSPVQKLARMELPLPPVRGTLTLLPGRGLGAVVLRDADHRDEAVALFECRPGAEPCFLRMEGGVRALAFEPEGRFLYAACHDHSMLTVIDIAEERVVDHVLLVGEPVDVVSDPVGRRIWVMCENLGHVALVDPKDHSLFRRTPMAGSAPGLRRLAFSPEGRLVVVPDTESGSLLLVEGGIPDARYGDVDDCLELGREIGGVVWSPLGDEIYVASPRAGEVLRLGVDRGDQEIKDTDLYLMDQLLRQDDPAGLKNPLFPP
ncbi:MAG: YncE family protein [Planctomycetes bacterium]|nr:YncE family protein [Planctomycetota bacterium]